MRILVVDDEVKMADLLRKGLEREHYSVMTAHSGSDGLELALAYPFDAIVLDVMIPGFDGFELARRLRAAGNAIPILFLTARDTEDDLIRGLDVVVTITSPSLSPSANSPPVCVLSHAASPKLRPESFALLI